MKAFLEEYGLALFTLVCISALILLAGPIGQQIKEALSSLIVSFTENPGSFSVPMAG